MTLKVLGWQGSPGPPLVLLLAVLLHLVPSHQTFVDHTGTRFILVFIENRFLVDLPRPKVFIVAAGDRTASVTISVPTSLYPDVALTVTPGEGVEHSFTSDIQLTHSGINFERVIQVVSDVPVVVQAASLNDLSSDAFLVLPQPSLGTDYIIMSYVFEGKSTGQLQGPSSAAILAAEKVTVQIEFPNMDDIDVSEIDQYIQGSTLTVELYEYETLQVRSKPFHDLTGARVTSTGPVSVVAGSTWTSVGRELMGDHLVENLPPVSTWGTAFYTVPIANRTGGDIIRILGHTEGTQVRMLQADPDNPSSVTTTSHSLNERYFVDIDAPSGTPLVILASRRVLVAQFCKSHSVDNYRNSDPFMALVPPATQYTDVYHFMTVSTRSGQTSYSNFLNVVCETSKLPGLRLNNAPISPNDLHWGWASVPTSSVSVGSLSITNGTYKLSHVEPNVTFGAMLYGLQFQESYGMLLGQRLRSLTYQEICLSLQAEQEDYFDNDCDGLFDEEIENGIDDDGDGLIDEDVFNDRMARPQTSDNNSLYYTAAPRAPGIGNDDVLTDITTTDSPPPPTTVSVPTTEPMTTEPTETTTQEVPTTTQPTTAPSTGVSTGGPTTTPPQYVSTEPLTTTVEATTEHSTVEHSTEGSPSTTSIATTHEATTLPFTTTPIDTTTYKVTTVVDTTLGMTTTVEVTTPEVTTVTTEGASTPVVTTESTTQAATTSAATTEPPPTTTEAPTTDPQTTTQTAPMTTTTGALVTTTIVTTEHPETTTQQEGSSVAMTTDTLTTEPDTSPVTDSTTVSIVPVQQQDSTIDSRPVTYSPLLEVLSSSSEMTTAPQHPPTTALDTGDQARSTVDPNAGQDLTMSSATSDATSSEPQHPFSPTPTGRSVSTLPEDQLKLIIPALILVGIPLIVLTILITRSYKASRRAARQGGNPAPTPPPTTTTSKPAAGAKAAPRYKTGVVDLR